MCRSPETANIVYKQVQETVRQDAAGVTVRSATITCPCGWKRGIMHMYHCYYCKVWYCELCAPEHFGKTYEEYHQDKLREGSE